MTKKEKIDAKIKKMYGNGYTYASIAEELETTVQSVTMRIHRLGLAGTRELSGEFRKKRLDKAMLEEKDVQRILLMRLRGVSYTDICEHFGIARSYAHGIVTGKKWLSNNLITSALRKKIEAKTKKS